MPELVRLLVALALTLFSSSGLSEAVLSLDGACLAFVVRLVSCAASLTFGLTR